MDFELYLASENERNIIANLLQFYAYDFSEYLNFDVEADGLYEPYQYLDDYWTDQNRFPYLINHEGKYIGFALVRFIQTAERNYYSIAEFFILKKYRRSGIGKEAAKMIFNLYKGEWEVFQVEKNKPAQLFWSKVIAEHTNGAYMERIENGKRIQNFISF
jgi:predicted acetyltransferase